MNNAPVTIESLKATAAVFGDEPLLILSNGKIINLAQGYIPLHVNFTVEDKAAKGLRKRKAGDAIIPPVYFSASDVVLDNPFLLLLGSSGSGKTSFARHLAFSLATRTGDVKFDATPYYHAFEGTENFRGFLDGEFPKLVNLSRVTNSNLLIILDSVENLGDGANTLLEELLTLVKPEARVKVLLLGDTAIMKQQYLPSEIVRHELLPLSETERRQALGSLSASEPSDLSIGLSSAAGTPILFALALQSNGSGEIAEELLDAWLAVVAPEEEKSNRLAARAYEILSKDPVESPSSSKYPRHFSSKAVQHLLAARHLVDLPAQAAIDLFHQNALESEPIIRSLLARLDTDSRNLILEGLLCGSRSQIHFGALLVSDFLSESSELKETILRHMLAIIDETTFSIMYREKAGRVLSRLGDPRDLTALATVAAGEFTFGSEDHLNSQPISTLSLNAFRIGIYPVVNRDYSIFSKETGRKWQSLDGYDTEKQNSPATDLSWYDARAYCEWLTVRWRASGKVSHDECVRLPTEPEWERAARGDQQRCEDGAIIYPWATEWNHDAANYEETGFNRRISVGLFPAGRSVYGCQDMAGQVWEWCTTLWGEDMATPSFKYPWRIDDGREDPNAIGSIRRVLRGGCFSSGRLKASCTYRGSLEPAGFWRGNGFRTVVAPIRS